MHAFMAAALATGVVAAGGAIPVTEVGQEGWKKYGKHGAFSVEFVGDDAVFTTTEEDAAGKGVDMQLRRGSPLTTLAPIGEYADVSIEGKNSALTLEGNFIKDGDKAPRYTSIVFFADGSQRDRVLLTWGSADDENISVEEFSQRVTDGTYTGNINVERVGWTDTGDKNGEVAYVDEVTVRGKTYDFGAPAVPNTIIPVEAVGDEGWKQYGEHADFTVGWTGDAATFTTEDGAGKVDMSLKRNVATDISKYRDASITGNNAFLTLEMGTIAPLGKYTSVVFSSDNPDQVILTWGAAADERLTMAQFQERLDSGKLKGVVYSERVGHTNTGDTNGEYAEVDEVRFDGTTYDFRGTPAAEGEGPEGLPTPEVDAPAAEGEGPDGLPTPEVDAPAAEGEGPDGPVMPTVKPEDPKPEDPKPEDPKPEDPKPEDPKPEVDDDQTEGDGVVDSEEDTDDTLAEGELADTGAGGLAIALLGSTLLAAGGATTALARRRG